MQVAGLRKRQRIRLILIATGLLVVATGLVGYALRDGIEFFRTPSEVLVDQPGPEERFRLGGLVEEGTWQPGATHIFFVTDGSARQEVRYTGLLPDLFREGQGVIATGALLDDVFVAAEVLARHDETYMPREVADALKEQGVYRGE
ncbi:MAG: cytochrome c maturation protein CcmE [Pseudomonadota bacterium]